MTFALVWTTLDDAEVLAALCADLDERVGFHARLVDDHSWLAALTVKPTDRVVPLRDVVHATVLHALAHFDGNQSVTAKALGIHRNTVASHVQHARRALRHNAETGVSLSMNERVAQYGQAVKYLDELRIERDAVVTAVWSPTCINIVIVSKDESKQDSYGRQIERETSLMHQSTQGEYAIGKCWRFVDEVALPVRAVQIVS